MQREDILTSFNELKLVLVLQFRKARRFELSILQHQILTRLSHSSCSQAELITYSGCDKASVSQSVARLVEEGLLIRGVSAKDRRERTLILSSSGRKLAMKTNAVREKIKTEIEKDLSSKDKADFIRIVKKIVAGMKDK